MPSTKASSQPIDPLPYLRPDTNGPHHRPSGRLRGQRAVGSRSACVTAGHTFGCEHPQRASVPAAGGRSRSASAVPWPDAPAGHSVVRRGRRHAGPAGRCRRCWSPTARRPRCSVWWTRTPIWPSWRSGRDGSRSASSGPAISDWRRPSPASRPPRAVSFRLAEWSRDAVGTGVGRSSRLARSRADRHDSATLGWSRTFAGGVRRWRSTQTPGRWRTSAVATGSWAADPTEASAARRALTAELSPVCRAASPGRDGDRAHMLSAQPVKRAVEAVCTASASTAGEVGDPRHDPTARPADRSRRAGRPRGPPAAPDPRGEPDHPRAVDSDEHSAPRTGLGQPGRQVSARSPARRAPPARRAWRTFRASSAGTSRWNIVERCPPDRDHAHGNVWRRRSAGAPIGH